jgi:ELWxxDGT repeat protein
MVKNAYPETGTADPDKGSNPAYLRNVNGVLMYEARDATHGYSLWRSDGTPTGTKMVKDIAPTVGPGDPGNYWFTGDAVMGNYFFVLGDDGVHGTEVWQSDGTKNGTFVLDINPGPTGSGVGWANAANGAFYIEADDGIHGEEPWIVTP